MLHNGYVCFLAFAYACDDQVLALFQNQIWCCLIHYYWRWKGLGIIVNVLFKSISNLYCIHGLRPRISMVYKYETLLDLVYGYPFICSRETITLLASSNLGCWGEWERYELTVLGWYGGRTVTSLMAAGMAGTNFWCFSFFQFFVGLLLLDGY